MTVTITFTERKVAAPPPGWGANFYMGGQWDGGEGYDIRFRYDPDLVELIKDVIPSNFRKWNGSDKCWSADKEWSKRFADVCRQKGHSVVGLASKSPPPLPPVPKAPVISWADILLARCATPEMRTAVYRALAKVLHTDLGGDGGLMQELNDARAQYDRQQEGTA